MLSLVLVLSLAQADPIQPPPADAPVAEPSLDPSVVPAPESPLRLQRPPDRPVRRVLLSTAGGVGGGAVALGITLGLTTCFLTCTPKLDVSFANAALGSLLITGVAFAVHQAVGGGGEIILPLLAVMAIMAGSAVLGNVINPNVPQAQLISTAIGLVPASLVAALILNATSSTNKGGPRW